jgi:hypothetical protein
MFLAQLRQKGIEGIVTLNEYLVMYLGIGLKTEGEGLDINAIMLL